MHTNDDRIPKLWVIFESFWWFLKDFLWALMARRGGPKRIGHDKRPRKWRDTCSLAFFTFRKIIILIRCSHPASNKNLELFFENFRKIWNFFTRWLLILVGYPRSSPSIQKTPEMKRSRGVHICRYFYFFSTPKSRKVTAVQSWTKTGTFFFKEILKPMDLPDRDSPDQTILHIRTSPHHSGLIKRICRKNKQAAIHKTDCTIADGSTIQVS